MARRFGVAVIGTGFMGAAHARAFTAVPQVFPGAEGLPELRAVADARLEDAEAAARRFGFARATDDWRSLLDDPEVAVVDVCTPPNLHVEMAGAAAARGKHVYIEKPVGRNVQETERIAQAIQRAGVRSFVGFNYPWAPALQYARQLLDAGRLGAVRLVRICFRTDAMSDPGGPWVWRESREVAGHGALSDLGSHTFEMARRLVGPVREVCGMTSQSVQRRRDPAGQEREVSNDDSFSALVVFANGATGTIEASRVATGYKSAFQVEVTGSAGALRWDMRRVNELEFYDASRAPLECGFTTIQMTPAHPFHGRFIPSPLPLGYLETKIIEAHAFLDGLARGQDVPPTITDALAVARLLEAVPHRAWVRIEE